MILDPMSLPRNGAPQIVVTGLDELRHFSGSLASGGTWQENASRRSATSRTMAALCTKGDRHVVHHVRAGDDLLHRTANQRIGNVEAT
jgi:hypothetical protein